MSTNIVLAGFAFYVFFVSLGRLMAADDPPRLRAMKKAWGRTRGLFLHFVTNVLIPLIVGVLYLARGAAGLG